MSKGIVVDHRESRVRYAISEKNFNEKVHKKVRDLQPGETVLGYQPRHISRLGEAETPETPAATTAPTQGAAGEPSDGLATPSETQAKGTGTK